jgi:LPS-assembly protein
MPAGGELKLTTNVTTLVRAEDDPFLVGPDTYYAGTAGTTLRATQAIEWQRQVIGPGGQVVTPFASLRGDAFYLSGQSAAAIGDGLTSGSTAFRAMPAAGVEWSLPVLFRSAAATQIVEPMAQFIVRPNEMAYGVLPNNDAQSLVFEEASLFDRDKFSGFDRNEGGGRLNVGVHYNGTFANGASIDGTFGQSFQVFGANPYAGPDYDLADVGRSSGLETRRSDYVGAVTFDSGVGPRIAARGRFDEATLTVMRAEVEATAALGPVTASATYFYAKENPNNDVNPGPASVVHGAASLNLSTNWRAFGSFAYDLGSAAIASNSVGVAFDNQCITMSIAYSETRENYTDLVPDRWINFRVELRTLGEGAINANLNTIN